MPAKLYRLYSEEKNLIKIHIYILHFQTINLKMLESTSPSAFSNNFWATMYTETVFFPRIRTLFHRFIGANMGI